ncbi:mycothiol system anti-sigma-R factor [Rhodococcus chondri]|uniref:Mycothiol system anti-sigma-R factor n=1 Tax=Rhodococcus chondri TaxID=3065941 RepID=A0ABU7JY14_9NOCA|nr:mycothiol system anti-sigma-R factor [Rhodococcus sp. CC-R104]MEE2034424.1 mycothiol system anti-sigma-R factor [Rhodococcus sp. CC-R104]
MSEPAEFEQLDCSAVIADVYMLLDSECDETSRARLQGHLDNCGSCLEEYGLEERIKSLLSRKCGGEHAPEGLRERLMLEIRRTVVVIQSDGDSRSAQN